MLDADDLTNALRAAAAPDEPLESFGLDTGNLEHVAAVQDIEAWMAALPDGAEVDIPAEFPTAGGTDHLYSGTDIDWASRYDDDGNPLDSEAKVTKSVGEHRFTLGPMYVPDRVDAHEEWTTSDELQKAVWQYVDSGDRDIRLQHDRSVVAGRWSEIVTWPYEVTVPMLKADGTSTEMTFPKDTVFLGVHWEPWAWELVKAGKLRGYSVGGRAKRILVDLEMAA
jgi:hypothetical protein